MSDMSIQFGSMAAGGAQAANYKKLPPEQALQKYMQDNKCNESEAKQALQKMQINVPQGGPKEAKGPDGETSQSLSGAKADGTMDSKKGNDPKSDFANQLKMQGFSPEAINQYLEKNDDSAIKKEAEERKIDIPKKPDKGNKLNFES